jgi:hypothetical protein
MSQLAELDRVEIEPGAIETAQITAEPSTRDHACYAGLNPPSDTQFPLEYAFSLLGDVWLNGQNPSFHTRICDKSRMGIRFRAVKRRNHEALYLARRAAIRAILLSPRQQHLRL